MIETVSILIAGKAGQGIASVETLLTKGFKRAGMYTYATKEYMSRVRGGSNSALIMVSSAPVNAPVYTVDIAIALDEDSFEHMRERIGNHTLLIVPDGIYECDCNLFYADLKEIAKKLGNPLAANTVACGVVFGLLGLNSNALEHVSSQKYAGALEQSNRDAIREGVILSETNGGCRFCMTPSDKERVDREYFLSGTEASAIGAIAGGCGFVSSYPMSPSTGVLTFLAQKGEEFGICVEQAEDEIAAFQMGLGVWYGGGRAMTTTSGGGFALMSEGMSLAGMTETPMVVYLAQRPGPATGLPTRTEQGDLELAVYAGHGEFPVVVLAPGDIGECFECMRNAFDLADRYQIPVIVLSDQYLADTSAMTSSLGDAIVRFNPQIVKTATDYRRYVNNSDGISPRGIPGFGDGVVLVDSDEHTEEGLITESMSMRIMQNDKRLAKTALIATEAYIPDIDPEIEVAIVGWGSTKLIIEDAVGRLGDKRVGAIHFSWVFPLSAEQLSVFKNVKKVIVAENNATGQFARLLTQHGVTIDRRILRYDGLSFFADELAREIAAIVKEWL